MRTSCGAAVKRLLLMLKTGIVINIRWAQVLNIINEENFSSPAPEETKEVRPSVNRAVRNYAKERNVR